MFRLPRPEKEPPSNQHPDAQTTSPATPPTSRTKYTEKPLPPQPHKAPASPAPTSHLDMGEGRASRVGGLGLRCKHIAQANNQSVVRLRNIARSFQNLSARPLRAGERVPVSTFRRCGIPAGHAPRFTSRSFSSLFFSGEWSAIFCRDFPRLTHHGPAVPPNRKRFYLHLLHCGEGIHGRSVIFSVLKMAILGGKFGRLAWPPLRLHIFHSCPGSSPAVLRQLGRLLVPVGKVARYGSFGLPGAGFERA